MAREAANCDCVVGRAESRDGSKLRYAIEVMCFGDPSRDIPKVSTRTASTWLRENHGLDIKFQSIAYHLQHHCDGAPRLEPKKVQLGEQVDAALCSSTPEDAEAARDRATSAMQADIDTLDEVVALSIGVMRHMSNEIMAHKSPASETASGESDAAPKPKKRGRSIADVQLFEGAGAMICRAIKLKNDIQHGRKIKLEHGVDSLKRGLLPLLRQMGQQLPAVEGDRPILMEPGADGIFNPACMPREDELSDEGGEFDEMDEGDAPDDDGTVT